MPSPVGSSDPSREEKKKEGESEHDSENDEDFVPTEDMDVDDSDGAVDIAEGEGAPRLSAAKRKAIDEAFEALFGYAFGTDFRSKRRRSLDDMPKREKILVDIFGATTAAQLLATSDSVRKLVRKTVVLPSFEHVVVSEVKRFAGRDIVVQKQVKVDRAQQSDEKKQIAASEAKAPNGGLDSVLAEIAGPSRMSTVAKTSADWDAFKTDTGVDEELEKQAQGSKAYLVKKDFLQRVDHRQFEREKAQRDKQRASRK